MIQLLKFSGGFAAAGLLVSLLFGFISGNHFNHILFSTIACTILSGLIGAGVFRFLQIKVPEILSIFDKRGPEPRTVDENFDEDFEAPQGGGPGAEDLSADDAAAPALSASHSATGGVVSQSGASTYGEHTLVNKVKIKNEPKLMAAAIRTMLARDDK